MYNGFKNFETWQVALTIANEYNLYRHWEGIAYECSSDKEPVESLAKELQKAHEWLPFQTTFTNLVQEQLLKQSLSQVDWHEIAEDIISGMKESAANG